MKYYRPLLLLAVLFGMFVVMLGAYTRLTHSGLGCPDWPGCYGQLTIPSPNPEIAKAYPDTPLEPAKAWYEMVHRYAAGTLGTLLVAIGIMGAINFKGFKRLPHIALIALVVFQAFLGKWTVTWKLHPLAVMPHLIGGMTLVSIAWILWLKPKKITLLNKTQRSLLVMCLLACVMQIILGGWTSSNYAALVCLDFPTCQQSWWPNMNFTEGFNIFLPVGSNYDGGLFSLAGRTAIHFSHRFWALCLVALYLPTLILIAKSHPNLRRLCLIITLCLTAQMLLGIANIWFILPLWSATAHNGGALILMLATLWLVRRTSSTQNNLSHDPISSSTV